MCFEQIGGKACIHCAKGKMCCIPQGLMDRNTTDAPQKVPKVTKPADSSSKSAHSSSRPAQAAKSVPVDYTLPRAPWPTKKSKKAAGKQKEVSVPTEAEEVAPLAEPMQQDTPLAGPVEHRSLFADIYRGRGISVLFLSIS